jgi:hypothetical protein
MVFPVLGGPVGQFGIASEKRILTTMDDAFVMPNEGLDGDVETTSAEVAPWEDARLEEASTEFLQSWNRLISTTNWEKGRIICQWRDALIAVSAPPMGYSDEAWSRRVGGVTPQHVGRLRRVYHRFHDTCLQYNGLYWSHFQAALDWDDAEMWLEGAVQNDWSVARMRQQRWETLGSPADQTPRDEDIIVSEIDEDVRREEEDGVAEMLSDSPGVVRPTDEVEEFAPEASDPNDELSETADAVPFDTASESGETAIGPFRPFEDMPDLPDDLAEAVETLKLAIVNHKLSGWRDVSCDDVLAVLNALKQLALAPAED